jgi:AcrR family transcriptional regulator
VPKGATVKAGTAHSTHIANRRKMSSGARRDEIVNKAALLFDSSAYSSTSMEDIATAIGIAKPTLYHYFKSKGEILFEIHGALIEHLLARHAVPSTSTPSERMLAIMEDILGLMQSHPGHMRVFFEHYRELPDEQKDIIHEKRAQFQEIVEQVITDGVKSGEFRNVDIRMTSFQILGACIWAYQWYIPNGRLKSHEIARLFYSQMMEGIGTK